MLEGARLQLLSTRFSQCRNVDLRVGVLAGRQRQTRSDCLIAGYCKADKEMHALNGTSIREPQYTAEKEHGMSAGRPTSFAGPEHHEDAGSATHHVAADSAPAADLALAPADLANLLANGQWGGGAEDAGTAAAPAFDAGAYDGHVALALDTGSLPDMDATLDMLTSSHQLFDVPALDVSAPADDASSA